jgi:para-aminobenzoate synthetase component 1
MPVTHFQLSKDWIKKALHWADDHFDYLAYHQHNDIVYPHGGFKHILAIGAAQITSSTQYRFHDLEGQWKQNWLFGYLGYDLKNEIAGLSSQHQDPLEFPDFLFFEPIHLISIEDDQGILLKGDESIIQEIEKYSFQELSSSFSPPIPTFSKDEYLQTVDQLIDHIIEGDFYEINFCQGFFGQFEAVYPSSLYLKLNELSPKPFSCFQKLNEHVILCASPERFLKKQGQKLISQPIKGTRPRGRSTAEDEQLKKELRTDEKELAENMMIVDLVRNDLARSANAGSVKVEEMFGIYSFEQVHQMISTISATLKAEVSGIQAIEHAFPMGSMTGAPKRKVMELTDHYEKSKRGAFSGAAGYFQPDGDFDFNVLIRSLFLNLQKRQYGFQVGSAITYDAKAENEYEECFVKAKALLELIR